MQKPQQLLYNYHRQLWKLILSTTIGGYCVLRQFSRIELEDYHN
ncbi:hypothetical protein SAMN02927930_00927 [Pseudidiomarina indica]|uniref:Uncharacterized protein n=1 Tax=Pseudidiomarina indica TaxID=1159017 RepID=A0A1G6BU23_9GAMM|nr:hypothetical protein SAMN02927930_00927 [Pseudidiomarina indica]